MPSGLPEGWRPPRPADAPAVAALIDEDELFARVEADHATFAKRL
jgi:hypothetical protein